MNLLSINVVILSIFIIIIITYNLDIRVPYPRIFINAFDEPIIVFFIYISVYGLAYYNPLIALLYLIIILFIHIDYLLLSKNLLSYNNSNV